MYSIFRPKSSMALCIMLILTSCCGCKEIQEKHFANLADAQREQMVEKGWVPSFVSTDAQDISFDEDMDATTVNGSYITRDTSLLRKRCINAEDSFQVSGFGPKWFRDDVRQAVTADKLRQKGYEVFRCPDGFNLAVLSSRHYVAYWYARKQEQIEFTLHPR